MKKAVIYIHGKGGSIDEANHYKKIFNDDYEIIGFNYKSELPWQAKAEFQKYFDFIIPKYDEILLKDNFANKINADLTILDNGEHWLHTDEQIKFLDNLFKK
mgnify:FL=1